jgi:hypothetical protein
MKASSAIARFCCALIFCLLTGCAGRSISAQRSASQTHLDQQDAQLAGASKHLQEARRRLGAEPDPRNAAQEVTAGYEQVQQVSATSQQIRNDVGALSDTASLLQRDIEDHRDDLLGPRGRRIRNRVILAAILAAIGYGLLQIGPLFGGPVGGIAIVFGHLLTAFAIPALRAAMTTFRMAWNSALGIGGWIVSLLGKIGNQRAASPA